MVDFLALDWEEQQLVGLEATVSNDGVRAQQAVVIEWPSTIDAEKQPQEAGEFLRRELQRIGVTAKSVLVAFPRERAAVRLIAVPHAPDEELPTLVRFQAASRSPLPLDRMVLDFLAQPPRSETEGREVLAATISVDAVERMRTICQAAGLELAAIGLSSAAAADVVARIIRRKKLDPQQISLIVGRHGRRLEISLLRDTCLLFTHSTLLESDSPDATQPVLAEISRSRIAMERRYPGFQIAHAWIMEGIPAGDALTKSLEERLQCEVHSVDPITDTEIAGGGVEIVGDRALYAGPVGMLLWQSQPVLDVVDFLNPRRPPVIVNPWKARATIGAAAALLLAALGSAGMHFWLGSLDAEIDHLRSEIQQLNLEINRAQPIVAAAGRIAEWTDGRSDWQRELVKLNGVLPGTDRVYLKDLRFGGTGTSGGRIQAVGFAKERHDVEELNQRLAELDYRVHPQEITPSRSDTLYPYRFELDIEPARGK